MNWSVGCSKEPWYSAYEKSREVALIHVRGSTIWVKRRVGGFQGSVFWDSTRGLIFLDLGWLSGDDIDETGHTAPDDFLINEKVRYD